MVFYRIVSNMNSIGGNEFTMFFSIISMLFYGVNKISKVLPALPIDHNFVELARFGLQPMRLK